MVTDTALDTRLMPVPTPPLCDVDGRRSLAERQHEFRVNFQIHVERGESNIHITGLSENRALLSTGTVLSRSLALSKSSEELLVTMKPCENLSRVRIYPEVRLNLAGVERKTFVLSSSSANPAAKRHVGSPHGGWLRHPSGDKAGCSGRAGRPGLGGRKVPRDPGGPGARAWRVQGHSISIPAERRTTYRRELGKGKDDSVSEHMGEGLSEAGRRQRLRAGDGAMPDWCQRQGLGGEQTCGQGAPALLDPHACLRVHDTLSCVTAETPGRTAEDRIKEH